MANGKIELELLLYNYWEHFKFEKDLAMVLSIDHPKRIEIRKHLDELQKKIHELKNQKS